MREAGWKAFYDGEPRYVQTGDHAADTAWYEGYDNAADTEAKRYAAQHFADLSTWIEE